MAKGQIAKETITKCILKVFDGSFVNDKEIRIPFMENGELVQIKIALTCAKVNIDAGTGSETAGSDTPAFTDVNREITEEEVTAVRELIEKLKL